MRPDTVIVIPSKRKPPLLTLENYVIPEGYECIILADPEVYEIHKDWYKTWPNVSIYEGVPGQGANKSKCYEVAYNAGFRYFFRMDDDLVFRTFVGIQHKHFPGLGEALQEARKCIEETQTTLVGFHNGANRGWMNDGYGRTFGLIHGGANLAVSAKDGSKYLDPRIIRGEDVYRTCAHRLDSDGKVGRVKHIGFDKKGSTIVAGKTSIKATKEQLEASMQLILDKFPNMVTCEGTREIFQGKYEIANWRMRKWPK